MSGSTELDALPCSVVVTDLHGAILFINQYALATFSISDQTRHLQIEQLFPPAATIFLQTHLWPLLRKNGAVSELYLKIKREPLAPLPVLLNVQEGTFEQQSCYRWVILPAEQRASFEQELIHARQQMQLLIKETEANKYMLQTVLDGAQDVAILAISKHGDICFANSGAEILFAQPVSDLVNKSVLNFLVRIWLLTRAFMKYFALNLMLHNALYCPRHSKLSCSEILAKTLMFSCKSDNLIHPWCWVTCSLFC